MKIVLSFIITFHCASVFRSLEYLRQLDIKINPGKSSSHQAASVDWCLLEDAGWVTFNFREIWEITST